MREESAISTTGEPLEEIIELVEHISSILSKEQVEALVHEFETNGFESVDLKGLRLAPDVKRRLDMLLQKQPGSLLTLAACLKVGAKQKKGGVTICWTGPGPSARMTWPTISDLFLSAKRSITIVGYSISIKDMGPLPDYLRKKSAEGVRLKFLVDKLDKKPELIDWLKALPRRPTVLSRPESEDHMTSLHAKCLIVDDERAYLGSANLTYHGTRANIELGLLLEDEELVKDIVGLVERIEGELEEVDLAKL